MNPLKTAHDVETLVRSMVRNTKKLGSLAVDSGKLVLHVRSASDGIKRVPQHYDPIPVTRFLVLRSLEMSPVEECTPLMPKAFPAFTSWKWTVELHYEGRTFVTTFTQGVGHENPPTFNDLMYCLLSDARGIEAMTFEDWCSEFGWDADSRKVLKIFEACRGIGVSMRKLLGADYEKLAALDEDELNAATKDVPTYCMPGAVSNIAAKVFSGSGLPVPMVLL